MVTTQCCVVELRHKKHQAEQQTQRYKTQNTPKDETFEETLDPIRHLGQHEAFADEHLSTIVVSRFFLFFCSCGKGLLLVRAKDVHHGEIRAVVCIISKGLQCLGFFFGLVKEYNGGAVIAMKGKGCVCLATDLRKVFFFFCVYTSVHSLLSGVQFGWFFVGFGCYSYSSLFYFVRYGAQQVTVSSNFPKAYKITDRAYIGLYGLATDQQTVFELLRFKAQLYKLREGRAIGCKTLACLTSSTLYERRFAPFYVEPIVCGLDGPDNKPFIAAYDLIGAGVFADDFVVAGTCSESLYGICEALWKPDLEADDLFEVTSQAMLSAVNRDALSGWGVQVTIISPDKVVVKTLKARQD